MSVLGALAFWRRGCGNLLVIWLGVCSIIIWLIRQLVKFTLCGWYLIFDELWTVLSFILAYISRVGNRFALHCVRPHWAARLWRVLADVHLANLRRTHHAKVLLKKLIYFCVPYTIKVGVCQTIDGCVPLLWFHLEHAIYKRERFLWQFSQIPSL